MAGFVHVLRGVRQDVGSDLRERSRTRATCMRSFRSSFASLAIHRERGRSQLVLRTQPSNLSPVGTFRPAPSLRPPAVTTGRSQPFRPDTYHDQRTFPGRAKEDIANEPAEPRTRTRCGCRNVASVHIAYAIVGDRPRPPTCLFTNTDGYDHSRGRACD